MSVLISRREPLALLCIIAVSFIPTLSHAQSSGVDVVSPVQWVMDKAAVTQRELKRSNVYKGAKGTAFRVNNIEGSSIENKKVFSLRVSDVSHIQELEEDLQNLYGQPDEKTQNSRVWYVKTASSQSYVLEIIDHPAGPKLISAHEGVQKTSALRKISRQKKRGKISGKSQ